MEKIAQLWAGIPERFRQYLLAAPLTVPLSLLTHWVAQGHPVLAAYAANWVEGITFLLVMAAIEPSRLRRQGRHPTARLVAANLFQEFGLAEVVEFAGLRSAWVGLGAHLLGEGWGVFVGLRLADVTYFLVAHQCYQWRERRRQQLAA